MTTIESFTTVSQPSLAPELAAPAWACAWVGPPTQSLRAAGGLEISAATSPNATMLTAVARNARALNGDAFRELTHDAYRAVRETIDQTRATNIVRIWNHIPGIHDPVDAECDRYMHFNAGRFAAMCEWFGGADHIAEFVPAASGVGHDGQDLIIRALATVERGVAVENPRQIPAFRYSRRYGPLPPCFARATRITTPRPALLIAGTAAITGEKSQHPGNLQRQLDLTLENLRILIRAALPTDSSGIDPLRRIDHARVYVARPDTLPVIQAQVRDPLGSAQQNIEFLRADLCRTDLLVEIEGVASLETVA